PAGHLIVARNDVEGGPRAVLLQQREHLRVVVEEPVVEGERHHARRKVAAGFEQLGHRDRAIARATDPLEVLPEPRKRERPGRRATDGMVVEDRRLHRHGVARSRNRLMYRSLTLATANS